MKDLGEEEEGSRSVHEEGEIGGEAYDRKSGDTRLWDQ